MPKSVKRTIFSLIILFITGCYSSRFKEEFKNHIDESDFVLFDGDPLHPTYAYLKNGKLLGLEFKGHPECGDFTERWYFDSNEKIIKIIIEKDFYSEHCGETFDSIYVLEPRSKTINAYTNFTTGKTIRNNMQLQNSLIDIDSFKQTILNWKSK